MTLGVIFPGQGSQSVGMLSELAEEFPVIQSTFEEASSAIDVDLWQMSQQGPEEDLNQTHNTQPALLAAGIAVWRLWQQESRRQPLVMAGHSLGEYTALVAAGVIDFKVAINLVAERGRLMQQAVPAGEGAMAAVLGLDDQDVMKVCESAAQDQIVSAVNFNSPGQIVIAGNAAAVERAGDLATKAGASKVIPLPVSVPSHCALMKPAAMELHSFLGAAGYTTASVPVLHNIDAKEREDAGEISLALQQQLYRPVRWTQTILEMQKRGVEQLIEMGPGRVLTGLNRRIDRKIAAVCVFNPKSLSKALAL